MNYRLAMIPALILAACCCPVRADDYSVQPLDAKPPADAVSADVAAAIAPSGWKVLKGESRTVCHLWLAKQWDVDPEAKLSPERQYPFQAGHLIGVLQFTRRGSDFRDQDISSGVYTLRYALQPMDGNHEGTSPTRDFVVLAPAEKDKTPAPLKVETLMEWGAEAAESTHPAMLCLQRLEGDPHEKPALVENADREWWVLRTTGTAKAGEKTSKLPLDLVVVGHADE